MTAKEIHGLNAWPEENEQYKCTGRVTVSVFASWLKNAPQATASLSPKQARELAVDLLLAANHADEYLP